MTAAASTRPPATAPRPGSGAMFDAIAGRYDLLNRLISLGLDRKWRRRAAAALHAADDRVSSAAAAFLDVATGTGDMALAIADRFPAARVVGVDPSAEMLRVAAEKLADGSALANVEVQRGHAETLPFADASFDGVTIAWGIRNVADRPAALAEMARVTRPGGRVVILEASEPRRGPLAALTRFYVHHVVPRLGGWLSRAPEYRYLERSIAAFPSPQEFAELMSGNGLEVLDVRPLTFGVVTLYIATPAAAEVTT